MCLATEERESEWEKLLGFALFAHSTLRDFVLVSYLLVLLVSYLLEKIITTERA